MYAIQIEEQFQSQITRKFYEDFAQKLEIFDPIDRDIIPLHDPDYDDEEEPLQNQAIKSSELKRLLINTPKILAENFSLRIPNKIDSYERLQMMFENNKKECSKIALEYLTDAGND